jgi:hypothetical protein
MTAQGVLHQVAEGDGITEQFGAAVGVGDGGGGRQRQALPWGATWARLRRSLARSKPMGVLPPRAGSFGFQMGRRPRKAAQRALCSMAGLSADTLGS